MTLYEMSFSYRDSAMRIRLRVTQLRQAERTAEDPVQAALLRRRITTLLPLLRQMRDLADLTEHYYERGYYRDERYCL